MKKNGWKENDIGWDYLNGFGCEKDEGKAIRYFEQSAALGCSTAMVNLGYICEEHEDYEQAYYWYLEAAYDDNKIGLFNLANMYHWGRYVKQDYAKTYRYCKLLYDSGYKKSTCFYLGLYAENGYVDEPDFNKAVHYYLEGIDTGDGFCATNLGKMYSDGTGVGQDYEKGNELYYKALELGDTLAYACIGYSYEMGYGVNQDLKKAREYYKKGAELGEEHCIEKLNECHEI